MASRLLQLASLVVAAAAAPAPPPGTVHKFPKCIIEDMSLRGGKPVFTDVRPFIQYAEGHRHRIVTYSSAGVVGMLLQEDPHDLGEIVKDVVNNSQAWSAGVRKGWIITEVDGRKFSRKERLKDVADDFAKAKKNGETLKVKYDVRTFLDCTNGDCTNSDRFPTDDNERCADACAQTSSCEWWSFGEQDEDFMCWLQAQGGSSLMKWEGLQTAPRACAPMPPSDAPQVLSSWPYCQVSNSQIMAEGGPVFVDVSKFINHKDDVRHRTITFKSEPDVGMTLREKPHPEGEVVDDVQSGTAAWKAGVRRGWIIKELDGKAFKKTEDLPGVGHDFQAAKDRAPTIIVKFDVRSMMDCTNADCYHSDKLPVSSASECAAACREIEQCKWWSFGFEEEDQMCFLRTSDRGIKPQKDAVSGKQTCSPPKRGFFYKIFIIIAIAAAVYYRQQICTTLQGVTVLQPAQLMLANCVSQITRKLKGDNGEAYDFDLDGGVEERAGLISKYGRPPMDFDEL